MSFTSYCFFKLLGKITHESCYWWRRSAVIITSAQLHSAKPELRFCLGSSPACIVLEIRDGEYFWQWSWLEIRLHAFRQSTIPRKQFIIIIIIIIMSSSSSSSSSSSPRLSKDLFPSEYVNSFGRNLYMKV